MIEANKIRNELFEPHYIEVNKSLYIVAQKKIYGADTLCLDLRRYWKVKRIGDVQPITLKNGDTIVPTKKGLFIDMETFTNKVMPMLNRVMEEK